MYSKLPYLGGVCSKTPQWIPDTNNSTESYAYYVFLLNMTTMIKFYLQVRLLNAAVNTVYMYLVESLLSILFIMQKGNCWVTW